MNSRNTFLILLFGMLNLVNATCQIQVVSKVDSAFYWVGDQIKVSLHLDDPGNKIHSIHTDTLVKTDPAVEILDFGKWNHDTTGETWRTKIIVGVYDSGSYHIPAFRIMVDRDSFTDTLFTEPKNVVVSTLAVSDTSAIAPIRNIITTPASWRDNLPWILGAIAFILLLLLAAYFIRKRGRLPAGKPLVMTPIAASDLALTQLNRLNEIKPWEKGKIMEYQVELTQIIRTYMVNRYGIPAMEQSTPEILKSARKKIPSAETFSFLGNLLNVADYVKFARAIPPDEIHEHVMQMAISFIKKTRN